MTAEAPMAVTARIVPAAAPGIARVAWVDTARGLGMVLVASGHLPPLEATVAHEVIYWFHMPLFFFLSGLLTRRPTNLAAAVGRRARLLGVPYFAYLFVFEAPKYLALIHADRRARLAGEIVLDFVLGGRRLHGVTVIFWFIPVLFVASCVGYLVSTLPRPGRLWALAAALAIALLSAPFASVDLPLDLGAVPYATAFLLAGLCARDVPRAALDRATLVGTLLSVLGATLAGLGALRVIVDMKYGRFDHPVLGLVLGLAGTMAVIQAAELAAPFSALRGVLDTIGRRSMTVMYVHGPVVFGSYLVLHRAGAVREGTSGMLVVASIVVLAIVASLAVDSLLQRHPLGRALFLGR